MKNPEFIGNLFRKEKKSVPTVVAGTLKADFPGATAVEWALQGELFEALFFHDNIEKIAKIDETGKLIEYRANIPTDKIQANVKNAIAEEFEIMNCMSVCVSGKTVYELIVRDRELVRYQIVIDSQGSHISLKTL
jgi:hypothetical protein